jgi:hypothetical protein
LAIYHYIFYISRTTWDQLEEQFLLQKIEVEGGTSTKWSFDLIFHINYAKKIIPKTVKLFKGFHFINLMLSISIYTLRTTSAQLKELSLEKLMWIYSYKPLFGSGEKGANFYVHLT